MATPSSNWCLIHVAEAAERPGATPGLVNARSERGRDIRSQTTAATTRTSKPSTELSQQPSDILQPLQGAVTQLLRLVAAGQPELAATQSVVRLLLPSNKLFLEIMLGRRMGRSYFFNNLTHLIR